MKVFVIDPDLRTIREEAFVWDGEDYGVLNANLYRLGRYDCFGLLRISENDHIYVDDNGLLDDKLTRWGWRGYDNPLAGIGVVMGEAGEGDSTDAHCTLEFLEQRVIWP